VRGAFDHLAEAQDGTAALLDRRGNVVDWPNSFPSARAMEVTSAPAWPLPVETLSPATSR